MDGAREKIRALDGVDLRVKHGELLAIMGPSGGGKSTLLNVLGALDKPTRGSVFIGGQDIANIENKATFHFRGQLGIGPSWVALLASKI